MVQEQERRAEEGVSIRRDPFARGNLMRRAEASITGCAWCGQSRRGKRHGLFRYGWYRDGIYTRTEWDRELFCGVECREAYQRYSSIVSAILAGRKKLVYVRDLPDLTGAAYPRPLLLCRRCGREASAHRGDYFLAPEDYLFRCCGRPMELVTKRTAYDRWRDTTKPNEKGPP